MCSPSTPFAAAPLKLSAPTSILQQADERATLVCHANKEYASCEWETPYGRTVSFSDNHKEEVQAAPLDPPDNPDLRRAVACSTLVSPPWTAAS